MDESTVTLADFFYRLVDDEELLERYLNDPDGVMTDFGIGEADRNLVLSGNLRDLQEAVQSELRRPPVIVPVIAPVR